MTRDLVTDANENLRSAFGTLADEAQAGELRQFGPLTAACTGVPVPIFNRVFVFDAPPAGELSAAVAWMIEREVPFWVTVTEPVVEDVADQLADLDLVKAGEQPGMAIGSLGEIRPPDSAVDIAAVTGPDGRDDFSAVTEV
ncbi:hypothetical protein G9464_10215 [Halostella sp. JP-L12]|uniref:hypothetical protein n=1 Tax=Halostella TaxID=1843185 RepID=UPI000EF7F212|nr:MULTISPECIES: hypothetical protein [Halostella]NHN47969.1 hypothetical protein [Halostella sp. JP-L12]